MNVALVDVDGHHYPNLALMRIAAWHKANGDAVEWFDPIFSHPDKIYASKVFVFSKDYQYFPTSCDIEKGGTGYDVCKRLPDEVERMKPDYSIYPQFDFAVGFLTRGCVNHCPWCVVPKKEGGIKIVADIEDIAVRRHVRLMDNNFLAAPEDFVHEQLDKMAKLRVRIDFNQALDARRITTKNAKWLAACKWERYIRFSCDTDAMIKPVERAVNYLREAGWKREIFIYCLSYDVDSALPRIHAMEKLGCTPFCMPFRDLNDPDYKIPSDLKMLARWCNMMSIRNSVPFEEYNSSFRESKREQGKASSQLLFDI